MINGAEVISLRMHAFFIEELEGRVARDARVDGGKLRVLNGGKFQRLLFESCWLFRLYSGVRGFSMRL
jgi:hypothetical protein